MVVAGNGQPSGRLLVRRGGGASSSRELRVVLEWFTELSRLVRIS
jgi:hypothetical protein